MNEDQVYASRLIPISVLALDVDPPSVGGWTAYLAGRGTPAAPPGPTHRPGACGAGRRLTW